MSDGFRRVVNVLRKRREVAERLARETMLTVFDCECYLIRHSGDEERARADILRAQREGRVG